MRIDKRTWKKVGSLPVDAGIAYRFSSSRFIYLGDPCYLYDNETDEIDGGGMESKWVDVCDKQLKENKQVYKIPFNHGNGNQGLIVHTFYGDGSYPVYAKFEGGRVKKLLIDFNGSDDDDEED
jgi:hypothetical protein